MCGSVWLVVPARVADRPPPSGARCALDRRIPTAGWVGGGDHPEVELVETSRHGRHGHARAARQARAPLDWSEATPIRRSLPWVTERHPLIAADHPQTSQERRL